MTSFVSTNQNAETRINNHSFAVDINIRLLYIDQQSDVSTLD